jgi:hypothetical protein
MDNPSSVLIDIHSLESTPADHDRNLTNKVSAFDSFDVLSLPLTEVLTTIPAEYHHEDLVQTQVILTMFICFHFLFLVCAFCNSSCPFQR